MPGRDFPSFLTHRSCVKEAIGSNIGADGEAWNYCDFLLCRKELQLHVQAREVDNSTSAAIEHVAMLQYGRLRMECGSPYLLWSHRHRHPRVHIISHFYTI